MKSIRLKLGREASLKRKHPWIFSGAIARVEGDPGSGETVEVISSDGKWLARAAYSPKSQIMARVWSFDEDQKIDRRFFSERLAAAASFRALTSELRETTAYRLFYSEADGIPGLIIDRYGQWLVVQFLSAGAERNRELILKGMQELYPGYSILDRSDADVRDKEGLPHRIEVVKGIMPEDPVVVAEGPARFLVDLKHGHKTGFYLDQRDNRAFLLPFCRDKKVLNCFAYSGGFGIYAMLGGASEVINVDTSADVLELARKNYEINNIQAREQSFEVADVFTSLRKYRDRGERFDVIILDPPKFVASANQLIKGSRGYKDINLLAFKLLNPGGLLFTFSCSGLVGPELFQKIIADAAADANRQAHILHHLCQSADHPVILQFPEGLYLKGLVCRAR